MYKYKVYYVIKGSPIRPTYHGNVDLWVNDPSQIRQKLFYRLKSTFSYLTLNDITVGRAEYIEQKVAI